MEQISASADLLDEPIPGQTLVELAGEKRVLIEHHLGVTEYGQRQIRVRVKYGSICICGQGLELVRMTKQTLVICGSISCIQLERNGKQ